MIKKTKRMEWVRVKREKVDFELENINNEKHKPLVIFLNIKWLLFVLFNLKKNINKNNNIKRNNYIKV